MTPEEFAETLSKFIVTPSKAGLNPCRTGVHNVAIGRVTVEYSGRKKSFTPTTRNARALRKSLIRMIDPNIQLNKCRGKKRDAAYDLLVQRLELAAKKSVQLADKNKLIDISNKYEKKRAQEAEQRFINEARFAVESLFQKYQMVLTGDIVKNLWDESVVGHVLNT